MTIILESFLLWVLAGVATMLILQYVGKKPYKPGRLKYGLQRQVPARTASNHRAPRTVSLATSNTAITLVDLEHRI